jgi:tetratricopeptide (TPR) repeat protein
MNIERVDRLLADRDFAGAKKLLRRLLLRDRINKDAMYLLSIADAELGNLEAALNTLSRVIAIDPVHAAAHYTKAQLLLNLNRHLDALLHHDRAVELLASNPWVFINRGISRAAIRDFKGALSDFDRAIDLNPELSAAFENKGSALLEIEEPEEALKFFSRAVELDSANASALCNKASCLIKLKRPEEALIAAQKSIELKSDSAAAWNNRGNALNNLKRYEEALASFNRSIELKPDYAEAWLNHGNTLDDLQRQEEALISYKQSIDLKPDYAEAWLNRGNTLDDLRRSGEALASYNKSIELRPDYADAYWNKALSLLRLGNFTEGLKLYEWRWKYREFNSPKRNFVQPLWLGNEPLIGKSILLHAEQGIGDTIQFCRYGKLVKDLGATVIIEVQRALAEVIESLDGVDQILIEGQPLPAFDYHCPLLSLPFALKTKIDTIPSAPGYLSADTRKIMQWSSRISADKSKPTVGIVWKGNPIHKNDHNRSIRLEIIQRILVDSVNWVSLQKDITDAEGLILRAAKVQDYSTEFKDFSDTAALIASIDLVVSVDTSVAHLAGAVGKPIWLLLPYVPDFRWLWDRADSPWYPTMKIFRQAGPNDWDAALSRVFAELGLVTRDWGRIEMSECVTRDDA